jgi:ribosomal protein S18 acetylase RimI-like enzyme
VLITYSTKRIKDVPSPAFTNKAWDKIDRELYGKAYDKFDNTEYTYDVLAKTGRRTIGFARLYIHLGMAVLEELIVHEDFRGEYIGVGLMVEVEVLAKRKGAHKIGLETDEGLKPAIALYELCGFKKEATLPRQYGKRPTTIYGKRLDR